MYVEAVYRKIVGFLELRHKHKRPGIYNMCSITKETNGHNVFHVNIRLCKQECESLSAICTEASNSVPLLLSLIIVAALFAGRL